MKTYLVPIDFSEAAFNAASFAASLSKQTIVQDIILINAYYISPYEILLPDPDMMMLREEEIEDNANNRIRQLEKLKQKLQKQVRDGVNIHIRLNRSHLLRAVVDAVIDSDVDLVIMGSKGNSSVGQPGIGSHVINVSKASPAPVIVVPPNYHYKIIDKAVLACDLKKVKDNVPINALHKLLGMQPIQLQVVNIDTEGKHSQPDVRQLAEESYLHHMLKDYQPIYHYINTGEVIKGILDFAVAHKAQMVIALPHKYSFLQSILHNSISQQLAGSSSVPVLLLK